MKLSHSPHKLQCEFLSSESDECFFGGARGGGKSWSLAYDCAFKFRGYEGGVVRVSVDYSDYIGLLIRRHFKDIKNNFKPICDELYLSYGAVWRERDSCYIFPSGARILLGHLDTLNEVSNYVGGNYCYLGIEEANQFPSSWVEMLKGSVRSSNVELKPFIRYTSNPGGIGHLWLKSYFYDKCPPVYVGKCIDERYGVEWERYVKGEVYEDEYGKSREFIPAVVFDNPSLVDNDNGYVGTLRSISDPVLRDMWLFGKWDVQVGSFFDSWNVLHHVISGYEWRAGFKECRGKYRLYRSVDYGISKPFACSFSAVDGEGNIVVFDEIYEVNVSVSMQAELIKAKMREWDLDEDDIYLTVVDPAMRSKTSEYDETPVSPVRIYIERGLRNIMYGNNRRVPGWGVMRDFLEVRDSGRPRLVFTDNCIEAIRSIPELIRDRVNLEDIDTQGDDHIADEIRYLCMQISEAYIPVTKKVETGWRERLRARGVESEMRKPSLWV